MKKVLFLLITTIIFSKDLVEIDSKLGYLPNISPAGEKRFNYIKKLGSDVNQKKIKINDLSSKDKKMYEEFKDNYLNYEAEVFTNIFSTDYLEKDNRIIRPYRIRTSSKLSNLYQEKNLFDNSFLTAWVEGKSDYGIGETIEYDFGDYFLYGLESVRIYNGYTKSNDLWVKNSRVKKLLLYINNVPYAYLNLKDTINEQLFIIDIWEFGGRQFNINNLKFEIIEIYKGSKYKDTAITITEGGG